MVCSPQGSSGHAVIQARILEWVAISFSIGGFRKVIQLFPQSLSDKKGKPGISRQARLVARNGNCWPLCSWHMCLTPSSSNALPALSCSVSGRREQEGGRVLICAPRGLGSWSSPGLCLPTLWPSRRSGNTVLLLIPSVLGINSCESFLLGAFLLLILPRFLQILPCQVNSASCQVPNCYDIQRVHEK